MNVFDCYIYEKMDRTTGNTSDHLANERTFLAWIRTAIGIMAFGFVVVKFSLFVRQLALMMGSPQLVSHRRYSETVGIILVAAGLLTCILAFLRYRKTAKQITSGNYKHSAILIITVMGCIVLVGVLLIAYLIETT
jgi:putative membrane protein